MLYNSETCNRLIHKIFYVGSNHSFTPLSLTSSRAVNSADSGAVCTTDLLQPVLLFIVWHIPLRLVLWVHNVTSPKAVAVEDGTCCYDLKWFKKKKRPCCPLLKKKRKKNGYLHEVQRCDALHRLQEDGVEPDHHHKGSLYNVACSGMMIIDSLGSHTSNRPLVKSDDGQWMLEA